MKLLPLIIGLLFTGITHAQPPGAEVDQGNIAPFTVPMPNMLPERFVDISKAWAHAYTRAEGGYDATNISGNSITISAIKRNAFRYQNTGETAEHKIRYSLVITFTANSYTLQFVVNDIYGDNDIALKYKLPDYYKSNGTLKDGYDGLEATLKATINDIVQSHYSYVVNYK